MIILASIAFGFILGVLFTVGVAGYFYYKEMDNAHREGWDMPDR